MADQVEKGETKSTLYADWTRKCDNCGQRPVVCWTDDKTGEKGSTDMCGCCTWGEAACLDPNNW